MSYDATPGLDACKSSFVAAINAAYNALVDGLSERKAFLESDLPNFPDPSNKNTPSRQMSDIEFQMSSYVTDALNAYNLAVTTAYQNINTCLKQNITGTDPEWDAKVDAFTTALSDIVSDSSTAVSDWISDYNSEISELIDARKISHNQGLLDELVSQYRSKIDTAKSKLMSDLQNAYDECVSYINQTPTYVNQYLQKSKVNYVVMTSDFTGFRNTLLENAGELLSSRINTANTTYSTAIDNANDDFNDAVTEASKLYDNVTPYLVSSASTYQLQTSKAQISMNQIITSVKKDISDIMLQYNTNISSAVKSVQYSLSTLVDNYVYQDGFLKFTGRISPPPEIVYDKPLSYYVEFKNVGKKTFNGYLGYRIKDEYKKTVVKNSPVNIFDIPPGETRSVLCEVTIPKWINGYTIGKNPTISFIVNRRRS